MMNQFELLALAKQHGANIYHSEYSGPIAAVTMTPDQLTAFAAAVALPDQEHLRIGQQLQRAAAKLPDGWTLRVEIEKDAGWVELYDVAFDLTNFNDHVEGLSHSISQAIDHAIIAAAKGQA